LEKSEFTKPGGGERQWEKKKKRPGESQEEGEEELSEMIRVETRRDQKKTKSLKEQRKKAGPDEDRLEKNGWGKKTMRGQ